MKKLIYVVVPALVLAVCVPTAEAAKKKKKNDLSSSGAVAGTIVSVTKAEGTDAPTVLTLSVQGGKKKAGAGERKVELAKETKFESLQISKKQFGVSSASIDDLKEGEKVIVRLKEGKNDQADQVMVVQGGKKKKKAAAN